MGDKILKRQRMELCGGRRNITIGIINTNQLNQPNQQIQMNTTLQIFRKNLKNFTTNEMERGLLETLMATSDSSTLKRNKDRRKSVKERRERREGSRTSHEIKRSRTRENNVLEDLERNNPNTTTAEEEEYSYY